MSFVPDAAQRCDTYALDPQVGFKSQYLIAPEGAMSMPGMTELVINKWSLMHGETVHPVRLIDAKERVFGAFFGTGVDRDGIMVGQASFARFNSKGRSFEADLEDYVNGIAGRFILILDSGTKTRIYRDPMGHMPLFYNGKKGIAGSSIYLCIDRPVTANIACARPGETMMSTVAVFPMGQTSDVDVQLMPGNHVLDLADFTAHRGWPLRNTIRKVTAAKSKPVIEKMAKRLRHIVQGWIAAEDVVLPLDAGVGSRILLAAAGDQRTALSQICVLQPGGPQDATNLAVAQSLAEATGQPLQVLTRQMALETFDQSRDTRQERKRLFWLRTSSALRVPATTAWGIDGLYAAQHVLLIPAGLTALQGGWTMGAPAPKPLRNTLASEIAATIGARPEKAVRKTIEPDYGRWKSGLPKTLQAQVDDFIRIELHETARAVTSLGLADHVPASPFSDREFIELALKLPLGLRGSKAFAEALIRALDPRLVGLPYDAQIPNRTAAE
ncbi:MAG: hypothetical protein AAF382_07760 [Pseudomonadota bacterium]